MLVIGRVAHLVLLVSCALCPHFARAQEPLLLISGLPCPGGQGEATNAHPLLWQCLCAQEAGKHHQWWRWDETVPVHYGDVVTVTWCDPCRTYAADWDFLRLDLVVTNGSGAYVTNSGTVKMKAGYNFDVGYVYWFTNSGSLWPTNFDVGEVAITIGSNQAALLEIPPAVHGMRIAPPLWLNGTNPISNPGDWPPWTAGQSGFPHWPFWITNTDGAQVIAPEAQLPFWNPARFSVINPVFALQALPGIYD